MPFHTQRLRGVLGFEGLCLQGICYQDCNGDGSDEATVNAKLLKFPDKLLAYIAGNAFQTNCCCAALLSGLVAIAIFSRIPTGKGLATSADYRAALAETWESDSDGDP